MKRFASIAAVTLAVACALSSASAAADWVPRVHRGSPDWTPGFYLRGTVGFSDQVQGDLNDLISADEEFFRSYGVPVTFDRFGGTPEFGAEIGVRFTETLSCGVSVMHQSTTIRNGYADPSGSYSDRMQGTLTEVAGNVTFWAPGIPGLFLGAQAGRGAGSFKEAIVLRDYADPANDADLDGKWTGSGAVFGVFAGYQQELSGGAFVFGRLGYRFRNLGHFDGTYTDRLTGITYSDAFQNNSGQPVEFDFGGVHLTAGLGIGLGGLR